MRELADILGNAELKRNEPMAAHTTFRIGGEADYYACPENEVQLCMLVAFCKDKDIPYVIIGNGSNLLFSDMGFHGMVIKICDWGNTQLERYEDGSCHIYADAGLKLSSLAKMLAEESIGGFEFAAGIPGTLGGAIVMNAGAYGGEMKDCVQTVRVLKEDGTVTEYSCDEMQFGYRHSRASDEKLIILGAFLTLKGGNKDEILGRIRELAHRRKESQPLEYPSAGSTFKRPEGHYAGKLIMEAGMRGYRIGDAMVSSKHCGFVVNAGNATCEQVIQVIRDVQAAVKEKFQVTLETEVKILGEKCER